MSTDAAPVNRAVYKQQARLIKAFDDKRGLRWAKVFPFYSVRCTSWAGPLPRRGPPRGRAPWLPCNRVRSHHDEGGHHPYPDFTLQQNCDRKEYQRTWRRIKAHTGRECLPGQGTARWRHCTGHWVQVDVSEQNASHTSSCGSGFSKSKRPPKVKVQK